VYKTNGIPEIISIKPSRWKKITKYAIGKPPGLKINLAAIMLKQ